MPGHLDRPGGHRRRDRAALIGNAVAAATSVLFLAAGETALAQQAATLRGPPVQVIPYVSEPGVPTVTVNPGTPSPYSDDDGSSDGTGAGGSGTVAGDNTALSTMMGTSWGSAAVSNAQSVGINPSALAATCVLESGCQNTGGSGTVAGAFQMRASTYTAMINAAVAQNPNLTNQIVPGLSGQMDPATESIAASEYLMQGAQYLQATGVSNPSVVDVRGYYNFGPAGGAAIANATPGQTMASVLSMYSAATLANNGITPGETVGQWQSSVAAKIGSAATQSVLQ